MNSESAKLIEQLAEKLGTTAEYLWTVLLSQAQLYAISTSLGIIGIIIFGVILFYFHKKFFKETDESESLYDQSEGLLQGLMAVLAFVWIVLIVIAFFSISSVITAIFNPEYWALEKLLNTINN